MNMTPSLRRRTPWPRRHSLERHVESSERYATRRMTSPYLDPPVAATYRRITAPAQFAQPARELVQLLDIPAGARVLDVGTGTGIVRDALSQVVSPPTLIVGVDPSIAMLRAGFPGALLAAGSLPELPF